MITGDVYFYKNLAGLVKTDKDKILFFDQNQKAFFLDPESDEWFNMMIEYAKNENLEEEKIADLEDMKWNEMPDSLKQFAFDYCILNGSVYED
mgnify:CR=1 FL=1